jgi:hypothetical protein
VRAIHGGAEGPPPPARPDATSEDKAPLMAKVTACALAEEMRPKGCDLPLPVGPMGTGQGHTMRPPRIPADAFVG